MRNHAIQLSPRRELIIKWLPPLIVFSIGWIFAAKFYFEHMKEIEISQWPTVNVQILSSTIDSHIGKGGTKYFTPKITYQYKVNGNLIQSDRVFYSRYSNSNYLKVNAIVQNYPPGSTQSAHYMPNNLTSTILASRENDTDWKIGVFIGLVVTPFFGMIGVLVAQQKRKRLINANQTIQSST